MTTLDHTHGVANNRCDHPDCQQAAAAYQKRWRHDVRAGIHRTTTVEQVRLHIATLLGHGMSIQSIGGESGVAPGTISNLHRGLQTRATTRTAQAILAVTPRVATRTASGGEPFVPRVGTVRRIQALLALGWPHTAQTAHSGVRTAVLLNQQGRWVTRSSHDAVARMYRDLSKREGPSTLTRGWARRLGYHSPAAWDDIDHDAEPDLGDDTDTDPATDIDHAAVWRFLHGDRTVTLTPAEKTEVVARWQADGVSLNEIARRTGWKVTRFTHTDREAS